MLRKLRKHDLVSDALKLGGATIAAVGAMSHNAAATECGFVILIIGGGLIADLLAMRR